MGNIEDILSVGWMSHKEERAFEKKITDVLCQGAWRIDSLAMLKDLKGVTPEEELEITGKVEEILKALSDGELCYAVINYIGRVLREQKVAKIFLKKRMKQWGIRKLLIAVNYSSPELKEMAKEIIIEKTITRYNREEDLKRAAARNDRRISFPAKLVLDHFEAIRSQREKLALKIEYLRKELGLKPLSTSPKTT